jgi:hypothetical protein
MNAEPRREAEPKPAAVSSDSALRTPHSALQGPVRVKVYGLFAWTRRRYVVQTVLDFVSGAAVLIFWLFVWPGMKHNVQRFESPPTYLIVAVAVLDQVPWILLCATAVKVFEMWIVFRRFAQKKAQRLAAPPKPSP